MIRHKKFDTYETKLLKTDLDRKSQFKMNNYSVFICLYHIVQKTCKIGSKMTKMSQNIHYLTV